MVTASPPAKPLKPPFPYFGGKSRAAPLVWGRFGPVRNYVEPFFGSGAVLFGRPIAFDGAETVNDADGFVCNFWRATQADPEAVARYADWPLFENDLHARHAWLVGRRDALQARLEGDPDYYDARVAGWWVWGMACWIGSGFCSGKGPWHVVDGELLRVADHAGHGINRQIIHLGNAGQGVNRKRQELIGYFAALADRLRHVRVCCGDWSRVMGATPMRAGSPVGVFLDPPYGSAARRDMALYRVDTGDVAGAVREWALAHGDDPHYRIALCGYEGEHEMPDTWECIQGKATNHGYGGQAKNGYRNAGRERIWFSPHCLRVGG